MANTNFTKKDFPDLLLELGLITGITQQVLL